MKSNLFTLSSGIALFSLRTSRFVSGRNLTDGDLYTAIASMPDLKRFDKNRLIQENNILLKGIQDSRICLTLKSSQLELRYY